MSERVVASRCGCLWADYGPERKPQLLLLCPAHQLQQELMAEARRAGRTTTPLVPPATPPPQSFRAWLLHEARERIRNWRTRP